MYIAHIAFCNCTLGNWVTFRPGIFKELWFTDILIFSCTVVPKEGGSNLTECNCTHVYIMCMLYMT